MRKREASRANGSHLLSSSIVERYECIYELINDLFTGRKPASNLLVSFCARFKRKLVFNETTSNYQYANYVSSTSVQLAGEEALV